MNFFLRYILYLPITARVPSGKYQECRQDFFFFDRMSKLVPTRHVLIVRLVLKRLHFIGLLVINARIENKMTVPLLFIMNNFYSRYGHRQYRSERFLKDTNR